MPIPMSRMSLAVAMIAIGIVSILYGNESAVWILIPDMPGSATLVYLCGLTALACGIGLLTNRWLLTACRVLVVYLLTWLLVLKVTWLLFSPFTAVRWESLGETLAILSGALCLLATHAGDWEKQHVGFVVGERGIRLARYLLGAALITFGIAHFAYLDMTASLVPGWLPFPRAIAFLTGAANIAAAAGMLLGFHPRMAANLEALMLWSFTLLVWIPRIAANPRFQENWTEWFLSAAIAAAAWIVAQTYRTEGWQAHRAV